MTESNHKHATRIFTGKTADFFAMEAAGGILLVLAAVLALVVANSPLAKFYIDALHAAPLGIDFSVAHMINDGLMAIFFFLVGLEIKRESLAGELAGRAKAVLPVVAAIGGVVLPALFYTIVNAGEGGEARGWAIPCATDIAFALGVLALLGDRVPVSLKILLTAVAIIDDLAAILIIALFYTDTLHTTALAFALLPLAGLFLLNRRGVGAVLPYAVLGLLLWAAILQSGIHATMAGVLTALFIPLKKTETLEHALHPWVAFLILPLFAFANAGVPLGGVTADGLRDPVTLGIVFGLFAGKQLGVFGAVWLAVKSGLCPKPDARWRQIYGMALLCGIGFTMSLFIGGLAFPDEGAQVAVRIGVLAGSFISAVAAYILLVTDRDTART